MTDELLIIFVKNPDLGKVKTRIAKEIGEEAALAIYYRLLQKTQNVCDALTVDRAVYYSSYIDSEDQWLNTLYKKGIQKGDNVGDRMRHAFEEAFDAGYKKVCLIGSDIYALTSAIVNQAFNELTTQDVVIGPAEDGGYYLIGMNIQHNELFSLKHWSHDKVYSETLERVRQLNLSLGSVDTLNDIDRVEDLQGTDLISIYQDL